MSDLSTVPDNRIAKADDIQEATAHVASTISTMNDSIEAMDDLDSSLAKAIEKQRIYKIKRKKVKSKMNEFMSEL